MRNKNNDELKEIMARRFRELKEESGVSIRTLSKACGISYRSILNLFKGISIPRLEVIIMLADYFAVPMDFLCGRCDEKTAQSILSDYPNNFMELRKLSYESYEKSCHTVKVPGMSKKPHLKEFPWPYNLLALMEDGTADDCVDMEEKKKALKNSIGILSEREKEYILAYYRSGKSFKSIAEGAGVSKQMVWSVIARGIKRLKFIYHRYIGPRRLKGENDD